MNGKRILSPVLCAVLLFSLAGCANEYKNALSMMESGDLEGARAAFEAIGDNKDAAAKVTECDYRIALNDMAAADYDAAIALFESLGSYEDAAAQLTECRYLKAQALFGEGSLDAAEAIFSGLGDYKDCAAMESECRYLKAQELLKNGDYESAEALFTGLGEYKDSAEMVMECKYRAAVALYEAGDFEGALTGFAGVGTYKDTDRYAVLSMLQYDKDMFIDTFSRAVSLTFGEEGLSHTLIEKTLYESWTEREFWVNHLPAKTEAKDTDGIALVFDHINSKGSSSAKGNINEIMTTGYVYPSSMIDRVYADFLDTAAAMLCVLVDGTAFDEARALVDGKFAEMKEALGTAEDRTSVQFDFAGYDCRAILASYKEVKQYYVTVVIPELVFD